MRATASQLIETMKASSRKLGPYVLLELLLPGGTLFALALLLYRRQSAIRDWVMHVADVTRRAIAGFRRTHASGRALVRMAECKRSRGPTRVALPGRAAMCCAMAPSVRTISASGGPIWRSRSFTAGGCPGSLHRG